jgi:carbamoyl-phosphate synthase large subunit
LSKVTGIPMVDLATRTMMGEKLTGMGYESGLWELAAGKPTASASPACALDEVAEQFGLESSSRPGVRGRVIPEAKFVECLAQKGEGELFAKPILYAVKAPVFSFQKLSRVEPSLGPEMKSTGEILGIDRTYPAALYKAMVASGIHFKGDGSVLITVRDEDKATAIKIAKGMHKSGRKLAATPGTAKALHDAGLPCHAVNKIQAGSPNILDLILGGEVSLMINTPALTETSESEAARIRRACIETGVPCVTTIDTAEALIQALEVFSDPSQASCLRLEEYFQPA